MDGDWVGLAAARRQEREPAVTVAAQELAQLESQALTRLKAQLAAAATLPLEELAAMPCIMGAPHHWTGKAGKPKQCKVCHLTDVLGLAPATLPAPPSVPARTLARKVHPARKPHPDLEPYFDPAEHRKAVRHAILTGQVLA